MPPRARVPVLLAALTLLPVPASAAPAAAPSPAASPPVASSSPAPGEILARIGAFTLTREMFEASWKGLPPGRRAQYDNGGGERAFLKDFVDQKLIVAEAERVGYLDRAGVRAAAEAARDNVLFRALVEDEVTKKVVTEEAMRRYYAEHQTGYTVPEMIKARAIVVTPFKERRVYNESSDDAANDEQARAKIERIHAELGGGADFAALARKWSEDRTAASGGALDPFARGRMAQPIDDAAFSLAPGKTSGVIQTPQGYHLIQVEERLPAHARPFEDVRAEIAQAVAEERKEAFRPRFEQLLERLRKAATVTTHEDTLPPAPAPVPSPSPGATTPASAVPPAPESTP